MGVGVHVFQALVIWACSNHNNYCSSVTFSGFLNYVQPQFTQNASYIVYCLIS